MDKLLHYLQIFKLQLQVILLVLQQLLCNNLAAVQAQVASLPTDALVSTQMDTLLEGIDSGTIPTWARGAVENVEKNLAARGLSKSSIGRDALVNAIIQNAIPIAQSNATASTTKEHHKNLTNETTSCCTYCSTKLSNTISQC
jgi:hypothetical protein